MITKRTNLLAGSLLGGALLLGTAGLALAQDPTPSAAMGNGAGQGMMNGQGMTAMHAAMGMDGTIDPGLMQSMHDQSHAGN